VPGIRWEEGDFWISSAAIACGSMFFIGSFLGGGGGGLFFLGGGGGGDGACFFGLESARED